MAQSKSYDKDINSVFSVNPALLARIAIFDFSILAVLTRLFLASLYPDGSEPQLWLSLPYLLTAILSKFEGRVIYPLALIFAAIQTGFSIINGEVLLSLKEWGVFFYEGSSLRFLELSYMILFTSSLGMGFYAVKGYLLKQEGRTKKMINEPGGTHGS